MTRLLFLLALFVSTAAAAAPRITLADYIRTLEGIESELAANRLDGAKREALLLLEAEVVWARGTFAADASLVDAIRNAQRADGPHRARLILTIQELRRAGGMEVTGSNRRLLEQIAAEQEPPALPRGGNIVTRPAQDLPFAERIATSIADIFRWIWKKLKALLDWFLELLPRQRGPGGGTAGLHWIVWAVVAAIVLLILGLAVSVLRKSRRGETVVAKSTPLASKRDEDPLSRGASEWERYAAELTASGQYRAAIRAWYHAVLVTCYAAGILHFRKGRTNWEYVASLPPSLAWRPEVIELTRRFEKEWYGAAESTPDALDDCAERAMRILDALRRDLRGAA